MRKFEAGVDDARRVRFSCSLTATDVCFWPGADLHVRFARRAADQARLIAADRKIDESVGVRGTSRPGCMTAWMPKSPSAVQPGKTSTSLPDCS
jgi:hypothetical protein